MGDIGELLSKKHSDQKAENREVYSFREFSRILGSLQDKVWHWEAPMHGEEVYSSYN